MITGSKFIKSFCRSILRPSFFMIGLGSLLLVSSVMAEPMKKSDLSETQKPVPAKVEAVKAVEKIDTKKILDRIREQYRKEQAFSGRFTQQTTYTDTNETTLSMGLIWIQGPDKMRWEYQLPEKQLLVSDGQTLWYHTPDLNRVMTGSVKDIKEARIIINLLSELKEQLKGFNLVVSRKNQQIAVALSPLAEDQAPPFQSLEMIFSESSMAHIDTPMVYIFYKKKKIK